MENVKAIGKVKTYPNERPRRKVTINTITIDNVIKQVERLDLLRREGALCLMAIHDLNLALRYSDQIVVLGEGTSRIGGRPLSLEDAAHLRASFEIGKDEFALRLVGKDGGVKRASSTVVAMRDIYDQIDAMPMRQQELRRQ